MISIYKQGTDTHFSSHHSHGFHCVASLSTTCSNSWFAFNLSFLHPKTTYSCSSQNWFFQVRNSTIKKKHQVSRLRSIYRNVPVVNAGRCSSLLLLDYDFLHPYSSHNTPINKQISVKQAYRTEQTNMVIHLRRSK